MDKHKLYYFLVFCLVSCQLEESNYNAKFLPFTNQFLETNGYNLLEPTKTFVLPETLTEISALALVNDSTVACVEDESGVIFLYSLSKGKMVDQLRFAGPGDYEGLEVVGDLAYVLKSNGNLYEYSFSEMTTNTIKTPLKRSNNAEGLAYDSANHRLLIACKGKPGIEDSKLDGKAVYSYHLNSGFNPTPTYLITDDNLRSWNEQQELSINLTKRKPMFMPSAIGIHPLTGDIYILATVGKLLIILNPTGAIKNCIPLSPRVFRQPEGICFTSKGDLVISSEGQDGNGKIQFFERTKGMNNNPSSSSSD